MGRVSHIGFPRHLTSLVAAAILGACGTRTVARVPATEPSAGSLLAPARLTALDPVRRDAWSAYLAESRRLRALDSSSVVAERAASGRSALVRALLGRSLVVEPSMTGDWFAGDEARRLADAAISFQTPSGGWSKRVDLRQGPRRAGQGYSAESDWRYVATFDNGATTDHLAYLARAYQATREARYGNAVRRGLEYVLRAQQPSGCWPQGYPLEGGYHDAATFNDDVMVNVLATLRAATLDAQAFVGDDLRHRATVAHRRGVACVVAAQVRTNGVRTGWAAQYDPLTLRPIAARAYEHPSVDAAATARVLELLMAVDTPSPEVVSAVHAAAAWFRAVAIRGFEYRRGELVARAGAGPLWARFSELGTNRPIFSNRDGVVRYRWDELEPERRDGYAWYTARPASVLRAYDQWARTHSRQR